MDTRKDIFRQITLELLKQGATISTMESCTSGLLVSSLTDTEGASGCVAGGVVTYSNIVKESFGVPEEIIDRFGVYSKETARAMAKRAGELFGTDISVGVTGSFSNVDPANDDSVPGVVYCCVMKDGEGYDICVNLPVGDETMSSSERRIKDKETAVCLIGEKLLEMIVS